VRGPGVHLPLLLAVLLAFSPPARADRESAEFYAGRGEKALKAQDPAAAEQEYRRAIEEDPTFRPARFGLAQSLLAGGRPEEGMGELTGFIADMKGEVNPPSAWNALLVKAERMFKDIDAAAAEIGKLVDRYADDLVGLGRKWKEKDPAVAERALRRALQLRPGDPDAEALLRQVDSLPKGKPLGLFNGANLSGWVDAELPYFKVDGGVIVADVKIGSKQMRTARALSGDYDVSAEARIVEERGGEDFMISLLAGLNGRFDFVGVGLINRKVYFYERLAEADRRILFKEPIADWAHPFDPSVWNTYALQFRGEEITALVNGNVLSRHPRTAARFEGFAGLYAQNVKVEYRNVKVQRY